MFKDLYKIKKLYDQGVNIIEYLRSQSENKQDLSEAIAISYDFQAGSYIKKAEENKEKKSKWVSSYANIINSLGNFKTIVEAGVGEATTLSGVLPLLSHGTDSIVAGGFDISFSRIQCGRGHLQDSGAKNSVLLLGDIFHSPLLDNSIDIVYTSHALEQNGGREIEAISELYRITKKYLVLFEPIYELGDNATKNFMEKHSYVRNLYATAKNLNYNVIEYKLLFEKDTVAQNANNTGVVVIEKTKGEAFSQMEVLPLACPVTKASLKIVKGHYFCPESLLLYPVIDGIPCLLPGNAIIATHFLDT